MGGAPLDGGGAVLVGANGVVLHRAVRTRPAVPPAHLTMHPKTQETPVLASACSRRSTSAHGGRRRKGRGPVPGAGAVSAAQSKFSGEDDNGSGRFSNEGGSRSPGHSRILVFGARPIVLLIFAAITVAMLYSSPRSCGWTRASRNRSRSSTNTCRPSSTTKSGLRRCQPRPDRRGREGRRHVRHQVLPQTLEGLTRDVMAIDATDDARARSLFTPNVRFVEVVEDGFAGGNVIPSTISRPTSKASKARPSSSRPSAATW